LIQLGANASVGYGMSRFTMYDPAELTKTPVE
jgi:hypothetical protein